MIFLEISCREIRHSLHPKRKARNLACCCFAWVRVILSLSWNVIFNRYSCFQYVNMWVEYHMWPFLFSLRNLFILPSQSQTDMHIVVMLNVQIHLLIQICNDHFLWTNMHAQYAISVLKICSWQGFWVALLQVKQSSCKDYFPFCIEKLCPETANFPISFPWQRLLVLMESWSSTI